MTENPAPPRENPVQDTVTTTLPRESKCRVNTPPFMSADAFIGRAPRDEIFHAVSLTDRGVH